MSDPKPIGLPSRGLPTRAAAESQGVTDAKTSRPVQVADLPYHMREHITSHDPARLLELGAPRGGLWGDEDNSWPTRAQLEAEHREQYGLLEFEAGREAREINERPLLSYEHARVSKRIAYDLPPGREVAISAWTWVVPLAISVSIVASGSAIGVAIFMWFHP